MNLKSEQIIYAGPFKAQRWGWSEPVNHLKTWQNKIGKVLHIWQTTVWMGMDIGGKGDFWYSLVRQSDGAILSGTNWDHYSEPTGPHMIHMDYAPNTMDLEPKDTLILSYGARRWNPVWPVVMRGDLAVTIWYTEDLS